MIYLPKNNIDIPNTLLGMSMLLYANRDNVFINILHFEGMIRPEDSFLRVG
jgi:hypothetical protein